MNHSIDGEPGSAQGALDGTGELGFAGHLAEFAHESLNAVTSRSLRFAAPILRQIHFSAWRRFGSAESCISVGGAYQTDGPAQQADGFVLQQDAV